MKRKLMALASLVMLLSGCGTVNGFIEEFFNGITVSVNTPEAVAGISARLEVYEDKTLYGLKEGAVPAEFRLALPPEKPSVVVTGFAGGIPIYLSKIESPRTSGAYRVFFDETTRIQINGKLEFIRYAGPESGEILLYVDNNIGFEPLQLAGAPAYAGFYLVAIVPFSSTALSGGLAIRFPSAGQLRAVVLAEGMQPREYTFKYSPLWLSSNPYTFTFVWQ